MIFFNPVCIRTKGYSIIGLPMVLNRLACWCEEKMLWPMKLLDSVVLNFFNKFILSELIIKCVIEFDRFFENF
jgi:hypothetical protein